MHESGDAAAQPRHQTLQLEHRGADLDRGERVEIDVVQRPDRLVELPQIHANSLARGCDNRSRTGHPAPGSEIERLKEAGVTEPGMSTVRTAVRRRHVSDLQWAGRTMS